VSGKGLLLGVAFFIELSILGPAVVRRLEGGKSHMYSVYLIDIAHCRAQACSAKNMIDKSRLSVDS
jgi:hypothetical protein